MCNRPNFPSNPVVGALELGVPASLGYVRRSLVSLVASGHQAHPRGRNLLRV